jgi:hypothetical protein
MSRRIEGIVVSAGAGSAGGAQWDLILFLCPWREVGGPVQSKELRLLVRMPDRASASAAMTEWKAGKAVALGLESLEPPSKAQPNGLAYGQLPLASIEPDAALRGAVEHLAQPRSVTDAVLGELVLDRRMGWYEGTRAGRAGSYEIAVHTADPDDDAEVANAVTRSARVARRLEDELATILAAITDDKLALYNSTWREERPVLTPEEFRNHLTLSSVVVSETRTTAYFACDDLFTDHVIEVRMAPDGAISEICVSG